MSVRVRFAPSPTGFLHVGGARTAIFNWLYARRHGGTFVLRIEDTDLERSQGPMTQAILDGMAWLGLDPDEGPYYQAQDRERHVANAAQLLDGDAAYRCFCDPAELKAARATAQDYRYPRTCRGIDAGESQRRADAGEPFAVRFAVPDEEAVTWHDLVLGETRVATEQIEDFVILRSDGSPVYMLSVVSDDADTNITHVIRGNDHVSNTPKQILLYRALGHALPEFAHLPMILGEDRKRLSKRHGAVSVLAYRDEGYLPEAMFNFLSLLGWSPGDDRQKMDRATIVAEFNLDRVGKSGSIFDLKKLDWLNGEYFTDMALDRLAELARPALAAAGLWRDSLDGDEREWFHKLLAVMQSRLGKIEQLPGFSRPYLDPSDDFEYEEKPAKKHLKGEDQPELLRALATRLSAVEPWAVDGIEAALRGAAEERGVGAGKLIHPTRLALTGMGVGPGIFEVLDLTGRERTLRRLERLIGYLDSRR